MKKGKKYIAKRDIKRYKGELDAIFNVSSNPEMIRIYIEDMGWDYLDAEIDRLNYIKKEICQAKPSKGDGRVNQLDEEYETETK